MSVYIYLYIYKHICDLTSWKFAAALQSVPAVTGVCCCYPAPLQKLLKSVMCSAALPAAALRSWQSFLL